jgi:hypothetical protein
MLAVFVFKLSGLCIVKLYSVTRYELSLRFMIGMKE